MVYNDIISIKNLLKAWNEFIKGKKSKKDVTEFSLDLSKNIFDIHFDLKTKNYFHGPYESFSINDPKPRSIHKATVRDRLLHHAIYRIIYPHFDNKFIYDSYSCRQHKGTHRALNRFNQFVWQVSESNSRPCWILKCDVRKFFASIDQEILMKVVKRHISDPGTIQLIQIIVESFETEPGKGLPLGNLTSQILVNIYMNEFDQFVKHELKQKHYVRYADDFVIMHQNKDVLKGVLLQVDSFLKNTLKLKLHPKKISIQTISSGIDFLGWVHFPHHRVLRTTTKRRMFKRLRDSSSQSEVIQSYLGLLKHGDGRRLCDKILKMINSS